MILYGNKKVKIKGQADNPKHKRCLCRCDVMKCLVDIRFCVSNTSKKEYFTALENNLIEQFIDLALKKKNKERFSSVIDISKNVQMDFIHFDREKIVYIDIK